MPGEGVVVALAVDAPVRQARTDHRQRLACVSGPGRGRPHLVRRELRHARPSGEAGRGERSVGEQVALQHPGPRRPLHPDLSVDLRARPGGVDVTGRQADLVREDRTGPRDHQRSAIALEELGRETLDGRTAVPGDDVETAVQRPAEGRAQATERARAFRVGGGRVGVEPEAVAGDASRARGVGVAVFGIQGRLLLHRREVGHDRSPSGLETHQRLGVRAQRRHGRGERRGQFLRGGGERGQRAVRGLRLGRLVHGAEPTPGGRDVGDRIVQAVEGRREGVRRTGDGGGARNGGRCPAQSAHGSSPLIVDCVCAAIS